MQLPVLTTAPGASGPATLIDEDPLDLIEEIGFAPYDTGGLRFGGKTQEPNTAVYNRNLTIPEAQAILGSEGY